jgi:hypothetical protein
MHPSNLGRWTLSVAAFLSSLCSEATERLHNETLETCPTPASRRYAPTKLVASGLQLAWGPPPRPALPVAVCVCVLRAHQPRSCLACSWHEAQRARFVVSVRDAVFTCQRSKNQAGLLLTHTRAAFAKPLSLAANGRAWRSAWPSSPLAASVTWLTCTPPVCLTPSWRRRTQPWR